MAVMDRVESVRVGLPDFRVRKPRDFQTMRASKARSSLCFNNVQQKSLHCNVGRPKRLLLLWLLQRGAVFDFKFE